MNRSLLEKIFAHYNRGNIKTAAASAVRGKTSVTFKEDTRLGSKLDNNSFHEMFAS